jgi:hypothetical protein
MVAPAELLPRLPVVITLSERSCKFYDGTYKWDTDGFTDDHGGMYVSWLRMYCT